MGYDLSLNFVKGICILLVLVHHATSLHFQQESLFYIWGYPAVPLFLLIQVFQTYKKGLEDRQWHLTRIWKRAVRPFLIVELVIFVYLMLAHPMASWRSILTYVVYWGGAGPGSYYPWIYIQFAILLPLLAPLFRCLHGFWLAFVFLLLSVGGEVLCSVLHVQEWQYRLLFIRYLFLVYLGYLLVVKGVSLNIITVFLSVVSLYFVYYFKTGHVDWSPWVYYTEAWSTFHWICYFYIVYLIVYFLCKFFYWLPAGSSFENGICILGEHSYAIYIFQLFYFIVVAPFVSTKLDIIDNTVLSSILYVLISILLCSAPVIYFVRGLSDTAILRKLILGFSVVVVGVLLVIWMWRPFYKPVEPFAPYEIMRHDDDSFRVIMIGDSWVYFYETLGRDSVLEQTLKNMLDNRKVTVATKGKGGAASGDIYEQMSADRMMATEFDLNNCSQPMIEKGADYCIISAGINDARQRRGKLYYVTNYLHIIQTLLSGGIRPVVMEIPDVEVNEAYEGNTLYYQIRSWLVMRFLGTELYGTADYRLALRDSLKAHYLMDSIVYVSAASWNPDGWRDKRDIYTNDHFHLNLAGYALLDSVFAAEIVKDYRLRKKQ